MSEHNTSRAGSEELRRVQEGTIELTERVRDAFIAAAAALRRTSRDELPHCLKEITKVQRQQERLLDAAVRLHQAGLSPSDEVRARACVTILTHLSKIAAQVEILARELDETFDAGIPFSDRARSELRELFDLAERLLTDLPDALRTGNRTLLDLSNERTQVMGRKAMDFATEHENRLVRGICSVRASASYVCLLDALMVIGVSIRRVVEAIRSCE